MGKPGLAPESPVRHAQLQDNQRWPTTERASQAILGRKVGMTQVYDDKGNVVPVTVVLGWPLRRVAGADQRARWLRGCATGLS